MAPAPMPPHGPGSSDGARPWWDALLVTAGAGMGVDSGLPEFRGPEGFWEAYPPYRALGLDFVDLANPGWFRDDPQLAWGFYGHRLRLYRETVPHAGFTRLLDLATALPRGAFVFTSNVDGQFQKAGFPSDRVLECHGSIHHLQCLDHECGALRAAGPEVAPLVDPHTMRARPPLPACLRCGGPVRPNILMFGDGEWNPARVLEQERRYQAWLGGLDEARLLIIEIGAGTAVPTVRRESERRLRAFRRAELWRINPREPAVPTDLASRSRPLRGPAAATLARILPADGRFSPGG